VVASCYEFSFKLYGDATRFSFRILSGVHVINKQHIAKLCIKTLLMLVRGHTVERQKIMIESIELLLLDFNYEMGRLFKNI